MQVKFTITFIHKVWKHFTIRNKPLQGPKRRGWSRSENDGKKEKRIGSHINNLFASVLISKECYY